MQLILPNADQNIVGKSRIDKDIISSDDWLKAKKGDFKAAGRVVDSLWSEKKTEQLKELIGDPQDKVLITMPSSSGYNVLPKTLSFKLKNEFDGKLEVIQGDKIFKAVHNVQIKTMSRFDRVFFERRYVADKPLDQSLKGQKAIIVDDIFTTGGSVKALAGELSNNQLEVTNVIGLMGDKRLRVDEKTEQKLKTGLKNCHVKVNSKQLKDLLTRTEAGMLIQKLNSGKGVINERTKQLAERIQRFSQGIFTKDFEGNRRARRDTSTGKGNINIKTNDGGIQNRSLRRSRISKTGYKISVKFPGREPIQKNIIITGTLKERNNEISKHGKNFIHHHALRLNIKPKDISKTVFKVEKLSFEKQADLQKKIEMPSKELSK